MEIVSCQIVPEQNKCQIFKIQPLIITCSAVAVLTWFWTSIVNTLGFHSDFQTKTEIESDGRKNCKVISEEAGSLTNPSM